MNERYKIKNGREIGEFVATPLSDSELRELEVLRTLSSVSVSTDGHGWHLPERDGRFWNAWQLGHADRRTTGVPDVFRYRLNARGALRLRELEPRAQRRIVNAETMRCDSARTWCPLGARVGCEREQTENYVYSTGESGEYVILDRDFVTAADGFLKKEYGGGLGTWGGTSRVEEYDLDGEIGGEG